MKFEKDKKHTYTIFIFHATNFRQFTKNGNSTAQQTNLIIIKAQHRALPLKKQQKNTSNMLQHEEKKHKTILYKLKSKSLQKYINFLNILFS